MDEREPDGWSSVDESADPSYYTACLEAVTDHEWLARAKRASHMRLDPTEGDAILDVGCGVGADVVALAELVGSTGRVVGVDNSRRMIERAAGRPDPSAGTAAFHVGDAHDLPYRADAFDSCRAERVFQHLADPRAALAELRRVTRPGGLVWVADPDWSTFGLDVPDDGLAERVMDVGLAPARNPRIGRRLRGLFVEAGLCDVELDADAMVWTDPDLVRESFRLEPRLERLRTESELSARRADEWLDTLRRAGERDEFLAVGTAFTVVGTVPDGGTDG
ncbi:hypothetical protein BRC83_03595 [Halobacteriales archaeon QS_1_68_17]|nr:MAG: hypothetical protein BRC83_03595 [Halobacteriales archaeon QS_1_68_17]